MYTCNIISDVHYNIIISSSNTVITCITNKETQSTSEQGYYINEY